MTNLEPETPDWHDALLAAESAKAAYQAAFDAALREQTPLPPRFADATVAE